MSLNNAIDVDLHDLPAHQRQDVSGIDVTDRMPQTAEAVIRWVIIGDCADSGRAVPDPDAGLIFSIGIRDNRLECQGLLFAAPLDDNGKLLSAACLDCGADVLVGIHAFPVDRNNAVTQLQPRRFCRVNSAILGLHVIDPDNQNAVRKHLDPERCPAGNQHFFLYDVDFRALDRKQPEQLDYPRLGHVCVSRCRRDPVLDRLLLFHGQARHGLKRNLPALDNIKFVRQGHIQIDRHPEQQHYCHRRQRGDDPDCLSQWTSPSHSRFYVQLKKDIGKLRFFRKLHYYDLIFFRDYKR